MPTARPPVELAGSRYVRLLDLAGDGGLPTNRLKAHLRDPPPERDGHPTRIARQKSGKATMMVS